MHTARIVFTVIMALVLMGCPPPVSDNSASGGNNPAQNGDNPDDSAPEVQDIVLPKVSVGSQYTMIITTDDTLWAAGLNNNGQLGDDSTSNRVTPKKIMSEVAQVSAGNDYTMILKKDDTLWAVGRNNAGQLGDGTTDNKKSPVQVKQTNPGGGDPIPMTEVAHVSTGDFHTMIVKKGGTLWAIGSNTYGQLGNGESGNPKHLPVQVKQTNPTDGDPIPMTGVASVSAGDTHTMILKKNDTLWAVGNNESGQLGNSSNLGINVAVHIMDEVAQVSAGFAHTMILKKNDTLWAVGYNGYGELGDGTTNATSAPVEVKTAAGAAMTDVAYVSADKYYSMIVKKNGELWAVGKNEYGQLGNGESGPNVKAVTAVQVKQSNPDGSGPPIPMTNVAQVSTGEGHTVIVKKDGTLWAVGNNGKGQLFTGTTDNQVLPVEITVE